jgi:hypothetical protein
MLPTWLLLGVPIVLSPPGPQMATVSEDGIIATDASAVFLDPRSWAGKRFPLTKYIDIGSALERGHWRLVFIRPGCPYCEEALRPLLSNAHLTAKGDDTRWALIELPSLTANTPSLPLIRRSNIKWGQLQPDKTWVANVPFTITVADGVVVDWAPGVMWPT